MAALTGPIEAGDIDRPRKPSAISTRASSGLPPISPHSVSGVPCWRVLSAISFIARKHGRGQRVEAAGHARVVAVDGEQVLDEIVGADGDEVDLRADLVELPQQARHFEHDAELQILRQFVAVAREIGYLLLDDLSWPGGTPRSPRSSET